MHRRLARGFRAAVAERKEQKERQGQRHRFFQEQEERDTEDRSVLPVDVSDVMFTVYPGGGAQYRPHVDSSLYDVGGFVVSCVWYMSGVKVNTTGKSGGLRLLRLDTGRTVDVPPAADRLVMFLSRNVAHQVLPTHGRRYAATAWFRDRVPWQPPS